ncbi:DUF4276 family protein [Erythrobacter sp. A6_0]|nr:DUF4276 family protein [Erythrobacter sp. A6_0]
MMYLAWAAFYEGNADDTYFRVLIPRILDDLARSHGGRLPIVIGDYPAFRAGVRSRDVEYVGQEICDGKEAFDIMFVHADCGGRNLASTLSSRCDAYIDAAARKCDFEASRAVRICPQHETEAWALTDPAAICSVLGYRGPATDLGLPQTPRQAESLTDPKAALSAAIVEASGRRKIRPGRLLPLIAQTQRLSELRRARSYRNFEAELRSTMQTHGFLR